VVVNIHIQEILLDNPKKRIDMKNMVLAVMIVMSPAQAAVIDVNMTKEVVKSVSIDTNMTTCEKTDVNKTASVNADTNTTKKLTLFQKAVVVVVTPVYIAGAIVAGIVILPVYIIKSIFGSNEKKK
jgi:hypothetical protein